MICNQKTRRPSRRTILFPDVDRVFNDFFTKPVKTQGRKASPFLATPRFNVRHFDNRFTIEVALPGFKKDDVTIGIEKDILTIKDAREQVGNKENYRIREFDFSGFTKSFHLPKTIDQSQISAAFSSGILTITLNKKSEAIPQPPKNIEIL